MSPDREGFSHEDSSKDQRLDAWVMLIPDLLKQHPETVLYVFDSKGEKQYGGGGQLVLSEDGKSLQIKVGSSLKAIDKVNRDQFYVGEASIQALKNFKIERDEQAEGRRKNMIRPNVGNVEFDSANFERELRRLKLEKLEVSAYPEADKLIQQIMIDPKTNRPYWDIRNNSGREAFFRAWRKECGTLPPPGIPWEELFKILNGEGQPFPHAASKNMQEKGNVWYLQNLAEGNVVRHTNSIPNKKVKKAPVFGQKETIYVMDWEEIDAYDEDSLGNFKLNTSLYSQPLLKDLGIDFDGVVNLSRNQIDQVLWSGEPGNRIKSTKHFNIIRKMGLNPNEWELSVIRQDQYARLANHKKWGKKSLRTHFAENVLNTEPRVLTYGVCGGYDGEGGASDVKRNQLAHADLAVAVRLVLQKKS